MFIYIIYIYIRNREIYGKGVKGMQERDDGRDVETKGGGW